MIFSCINNRKIISADHETGGLALGRNFKGPLYPNPYNWNPSILSSQSKSSNFIASKFKDEGMSLEECFRNYVGFDLTADEIEKINNNKNDNYYLNRAITDVITQRALVGWTTWGHTAVDINLYCYYSNNEICNKFFGNHDNIYVGNQLSEIFDLDLKSITESLQDFQVSTKNEILVKDENH